MAAEASGDSGEQLAQGCRPARLAAAVLMWYVVQMDTDYPELADADIRAALAYAADQ